MTLQTIYRYIAPMGSLKHIYVSSFGERFPPGLLHPVSTPAGSCRVCVSPPVLIGASSSSPCRACTFRFLPGTPHPVLTGLAGLVHPVLTGSSSPGPDIPSGGTEIPTISPFTSAWDVSPVRSAFGTSPACRMEALWSAYPTHSRPCGSSSA